MSTQTPAVLPRTERRLRREGRSAALRERALALRMAGWTYAAIGQALGVSSTRALQLVRKAEWIIRSSEKGVPAKGRPSDSNDPRQTGRTEFVACTVYDPPPT
jgi:hypothetical protein